MTRKHLNFSGVDFPDGRFPRPGSPGFLGKGILKVLSMRLSTKPRMFVCESWKELGELALPAGAPKSALVFLFLLPHWLLPSACKASDCVL